MIIFNILLVSIVHLKASFFHFSITLSDEKKMIYRYFHVKKYIGA
jgi:hypothetical protein